MTENRKFDKIYGNYKKLVFKIAYEYVGDRDIAEDILQETFLALYKDMEEKEYTTEAQYSNIVSWLCTTTKRKALNYRKKNDMSLF